MHHIADWLETLGFGQYAQRFADNGIDLSVLPELTDKDLDSLGSCSDIVARCCA